MSSGTLRSSGSISTLNVSGTYTHTNGTTLATNLNVYGTFTHSAGTTTISNFYIHNGGTVNANAANMTATNFYLYGGGRFIHATGSNAIIGTSRFVTVGQNLALGAGIYEIRNHGSSAITTNATASGWGNVEINQTTGNAIAFGTNNLTIANLNIVSGALVPGTGRTHTVTTLSFNGTGQVEGTWGSTGSSATNKNNTYFASANNGMLNVLTCTATESLKPAISGPVCPGATSVSGTSAEPNGSVITVFKFSEEIGTTTVSGGNWTLSGIDNTLLNGNDQLTASVRAPGECPSPASDEYVVIESADIGLSLDPFCQGEGSQPMGGSLTVEGGSTAGIWSGGAGSWTNASDPANATYTAGASELGDITLTLTATGGICGTRAVTKTVTVTAKPTIDAPDAPSALCAGASYEPTPPTVTDNGSAITSEGWQIETAVGSNTYTSLTVPYSVAFADNGKKVRYTAENGCGTSNSTSVTLTVNNPPTVATPASPSALCSGASYNPSAPTVTANGSAVTSQGWEIETSVGSNTYTTLAVPYSVALGDNGKKVRYTATNDCGTTSSTPVTLTVNGNNTAGAASSSPSVTVNTAMTSITHSTTVATGIGSATGLPAGVTANWSSNVITISGTPTATGTFNYTIPLTGGCGSVNATGTITVNPAEGNYRTTAANALFSSKTNWEVCIGASCSPATRAPGSGDNVEIRHATTMDVNFTTGSGKTLTITGGSLTINPTRTYTITGSANFGGFPVTLKSTASGTASMGQITGNLSGANNVTVERYFQARRKWRAVCAPLSGTSNNSIYYNWQNNGVFSSGTGALIWSNVNQAPRTELSTGIYDCGAVGLSSMVSYNSTTGEWDKTLNTKTNTLFDNSRPKPYLLFVTGNYNQNGDYLQLNLGAAPTTLKATGSLIKGPISYTNTVAANGQYGMFANPFASSIDLSVVTRSGFDPFVYIWDPGMTNLGGFQTLSLGSSQIIESGQAFFMRANSGSNNLTFEEGDKVSTSSNTAFFRNSSNTTPSRIRVDLNKYTGATLGLYDRVNVEFVSGANAGIDGYDASKFAQFAENISILRNGTDLAYETRPEITGNETIQFRIWGMKDPANYQLKFDMSNVSIPAGYAAVLQDAFLNRETVLSSNGITPVDFSVTANPASFDQQRFRIVFRSNVVTSSTNLDAAKSLAVYPNPVLKGKDMQIAFKNKAAGQYNITVYTITGIQVQRAVIRHSGGSAIQTLALDQKLNAGNYLLEVTNEKGEREHTKLIIQ